MAIHYLTCLFDMVVRKICDARLSCIYGARDCMLAKAMNLGNLGYYMHLVLYFVDLIRSSFGGVSEHKYIYIYIYIYTCICQ
jgi:hypothetical protein